MELVSLRDGGVRTEKCGRHAGNGQTILENDVTERGGGQKGEGRGKLSGEGGRCKLNLVAEEVITTGTCPAVVARCMRAPAMALRKNLPTQRLG